jgi:hypothetical protein
MRSLFYSSSAVTTFLAAFAATGSVLLLWIALILVILAVIPWPGQSYALPTALLLVILFLLGA